jgi:hypothetical protein
VGVTGTFILAALLCFSLGFLASRLIFEEDDVCRLLVARSFPDDLRDLKNSETAHSFAETLSANWQTYHIMSHGDGELMVFCFSKPEDAAVFHERFGGERLPGSAAQ